jgi:hypothetical protein
MARPVATAAAWATNERRVRVNIECLLEWDAADMATKVHKANGWGPSWALGRTIVSYDD